MSSYHSHFLLILLSSITITLSKRTYTFKIDVTSGGCLCYPSTEDPLYFRLCNNALCSTFTSIPNGLNGGNLYTYQVTTPYDYGTINKIQIVHTGDDQLCLDWVEVDGAQYDWSTAPYCWSGNNDATCSTLTVTSANDWSYSDTNPCEFESVFDNTYIPTPIPTQPTISPTFPSKPPTKSPTPAPTDNPTTAFPTHDPTKSTVGPTTDPTLEPTQEPTKLTKSPTHNPTLLPTLAPTTAPFGSANVDPDTTTTTNNDIDGQNGMDKAGGVNTDETDGITVGLVMGIIFAALFCMTFLVLLVYCCHTRKKHVSKGGAVEINLSDSSVMPSDGHTSTLPKDIPDLPPAASVDPSEGGGPRKSGGPGSIDWDEDDEEEEDVVVVQSIPMQEQDNDAKEDEPYMAPLNDEDVYHDKETAGGDIEMLYEKPSDDMDTMTDVGTMGSTVNIALSKNNDNNDDDDDDDKLDEMYNKERSTKSKKSEKNGDSDTDNMYKN